MRKIALVLVVFLLTANISFAGYTPIIIEIENGVPGYYTYQIGIHDIGNGGISRVGDIVVENVTVNQVWRYGGYDSTPTYVKASSLTPAQKLLDTHLLDMSIYGFGVAMSGSAVNEAVVDTAADPPAAGPLGAAGYWGMDIPGEGYPGDGSGTGIGTYAIENPPEGLNDIMFMQIVFAEEDLMRAVIRGKYTNPAVANAGGAMMPFEIKFVPEPSTIIMLVTGALCLVGFRLRRRKSA